MTKLVQTDIVDDDVRLMGTTGVSTKIYLGELLGEGDVLGEGEFEGLGELLGDGELLGELLGDGELLGELLGDLDWPATKAVAACSGQTSLNWLQHESFACLLRILVRSSAALYRQEY